MKAVIMAGGEGTRLRPLTTNAPKPMLPIANTPMLEHVVTLLKKHGVDEIVITVAYMANLIRNYFGDGSDFGVKIVYATEEVPLGTAGSVRNAMAELNDPFLVISGDVLTDIDLSSVVDFHFEKKSLVTLALKRIENPIDFGIVIADRNGTIERFLEKPTWGQVFSDTINTGIYVLDPEVFSYIPPEQSCDFSSEVFPKMLDDSLPVFGHIVEGYWEDVGTLNAYLKAHTDVLGKRVEVAIDGFELKEGVFVADDADIAPEAIIEGPAIIGSNCSIGEGVKIGADVILGSNVRIGDGATVEHSVVMENSYIGSRGHLRGTIIGRSCDIRSGAQILEGSVLGDSCYIGDHAVIENDVKIYPNKNVETGAIVSSSIVWETGGARNLFGLHGVSGLANVDLGPELALRIAMAWATTIKKGSEVVVSRDSARASRMLKRSLMVGFNAAGINVADLEVATVPLTRFGTRLRGSSGGVTVRLNQENPNIVTIRFFDHLGRDIDESTQRRIERIFYREECRRVKASDIGDINFPTRLAELYTEELMSSVEPESIRAHHFKAVVDYSFGSASFVMPNVLSKLGGNVLAINPYGATKRSIDNNRLQAAREVERIVVASGAEIGAVIDRDGEQITLVDENGQIVSDETALLAFISLLCESKVDSGKKPKIAVPISATMWCDEVSETYGCMVERTKLSVSYLLETAGHAGMDFVGSTWGGFAFPSFLPAFDGAAALVQLLDLLARSKRTLGEVVSSLPKVDISHIEVDTPWSKKGTVMRAFVESYPNDSDLLMLDGVKIMDHLGWTLVLPDPERPVTHIWTEDKENGQSMNRALKVQDDLKKLIV
ncbi:MAG: NTP transferase domain-containing protein [Acidimicrobiales bacterium]|nr:NTP transferase domain-containing protein [Acidimicrobiales bacterium]